MDTGLVVGEVIAAHTVARSFSSCYQVLLPEHVTDLGDTCGGHRATYAGEPTAYPVVHR